MSGSGNPGTGQSQANVRVPTGPANSAMISERHDSGMTRAVTTRGLVRGWQHWTPYGAVVWSLVYAALGIYWMVSGHGFPYDPKLVSEGVSSVVGQLAPIAAWAIVTAAGIPAAAMGIAMLREVRVLRPIFITIGLLLAGILLLLMTDINLLILLGYVPMGIVKLLAGAGFGKVYLQALTQWSVVHQLLCLVDGFLWLGATVSYARRSGDACLNCGRQDGPEGWTSPDMAARWGRIAAYVAMVVPVVYAITRYAWALGIPLGISEEHLRSGQESGRWISGLSLATFGLVGAALMLGLVQRWGEVFPRWMIGLAGRRVPIALAVVPAAIVSVLLMTGGMTMWSSYDRVAENATATGENIWIVVGPVWLFPIWAVSLAVATLGYYYRRRVQGVWTRRTRQGVKFRSACDPAAPPAIPCRPR